MKIYKLSSGKMFFKDIAIGETFHTGFSKGMGANSETTIITIYKKISPSEAQVIKADWAPRQIGRKDRMAPLSPIWAIKQTI